MLEWWLENCTPGPANRHAYHIPKNFSRKMLGGALPAVPEIIDLHHQILSVTENWEMTRILRFDSKMSIWIKLRTTLQGHEYDYKGRGQSQGSGHGHDHTWERLLNLSGTWVAILHSHVTFLTIGGTPFDGTSAHTCSAWSDSADIENLSQVTDDLFTPRPSSAPHHTGQITAAW